jgi:putative phosphoesterase
MNIGLISDTHSYLDPKIAGYISSCDEILHAGDIGSLDLLESLQRLKPTQAVYGNIDGPEIRTVCPQDLWLEREGVRILMTHIAGKPGKYHPRVKSLLRQKTPDLLICGHSHILKVTKDPEFGGLMFINPGAAGRQGLHHQKTIMRMSLQKGKVTNLEVIELGKRGSLE